MICQINPATPPPSRHYVDHHLSWDRFSKGIAYSCGYDKVRRRTVDSIRTIGGKLEEESFRLVSAVVGRKV